MAMNRAQFAAQLQEGLNANFGVAYKRKPEAWKQIFSIHKSNKAYEEDVLNVALGPAREKGEGAGVEYDEAELGWTKRYKHVTYALATAITEEAHEDNLYFEQGPRMAKFMAHSFKYTKEVNGHAVLNNGFSTSFPGGDGKPLFATDHPLVGGGTQSNKLSVAADLSETALEAACIQIDGWTDDRGLPVDVGIKCLVVPRFLQFVVARILESVNQSGTANNDINALNNANSIPKYMSTRYLTDANAWFLITDCDDGLKHFRRIPLGGGMEGDFESGNLRFKKRERYSFGWSDWRGAFASEGVTRGSYSGAS